MTGYYLDKQELAVNLRIDVILVVTLFSAIAVGCSDSAERISKRDHDRAAMQISEAERQRDAYKQQADQLRADVLNSENKAERAEKDLADSNGKLKQAQDAVEAARLNQINADRTAAQLKTAEASLASAQKQNEETLRSLASLRSTLTEQKSQLELLTRQNHELVEELRTAHDVPATRPAATDPAN